MAEAVHLHGGMPRNRLYGFIHLNERCLISTYVYFFNRIF